MKTETQKHIEKLDAFRESVRKNMFGCQQPIFTKYLPATETKGSRVKASCERGSITLSWPCELGTQEAHCYAAQCLVERFIAQDAKKYGSDPVKNPWNGKRYMGGIKGGYVHVFGERMKP